MSVFIYEETEKLGGLKVMPKIEISDNTERELKAFIKVIDAILEEKLGKGSDYAELVISVGIEKMLQDPLPKQEMLLKTVVKMFKQNPEFVSAFIAEALKKGEMGAEELEKARNSWKFSLVH